MSAVFEIDSTARADGNHWTGILTVTVEGDEAVAITYNGQSIAAGEPVPVTFLPSLGTIEIRVGEVLLRSGSRRSTAGQH